MFYLEWRCILFFPGWWTTREVLRCRLVLQHIAIIEIGTKFDLSSPEIHTSGQKVKPKNMMWVVYYLLAPWNHFPTNCGFLGAQKWSVKKGYTSAMLRCCCFFLLMHSMFCSELVTKCEIICTYLNLIVFLDFFFFWFSNI